jgi:phenylpropionate dioxygenase-like ring-hydroxylating dioxygenase large terminal subunit
VCPGHGWAFDGHGEVYKRNEFGRVDPKGRVPVLTLRDTGSEMHTQEH